MKMSQVIEVLKAGIANNTDCEVDMQVLGQKVVKVGNKQLRITKMDITLYEEEDLPDANTQQPG